MAIVDKTKLMNLEDGEAMYTDLRDRLNEKADKTGTVLNTFLSRGRKANTTEGYASVAFGVDVEASGYASHAEGEGTTASDQDSHAEGYGTSASGTAAHAEGSSTEASGDYSHSEGTYTEATGAASHAEGEMTHATANGAHAEGSHTKADAIAAHAEGYYTEANEQYSHAEGQNSIADEQSAHAEGLYTTAAGEASHSEGNHTSANNNSSHAEGYYTSASNNGAHAEGGYTSVSGMYAHSEGAYGSATDMAAHSEGLATHATASAAHSEGVSTTASGPDSHSEGAGTVASGFCAHSEGSGTLAAGTNSHAEGGGSKAYGPISHAEGCGTIAAGESSHVFGKYNVSDELSDDIQEWVANTHYYEDDLVKRTVTETVDEVTTTTVTGYKCYVENTDPEFTVSHWVEYSKMKYVEIVGNGTDTNACSNARALDWEGNEYLAGDLYVGCDSESKNGRKVAKKDEAAPVIIESASGNPIRIEDGADDLPVSECKLTLLPRQSGSGDASPENVRPLIPWENVGTWTGGKNLFDKANDVLGGYITSGGIFKTSSSGEKTISVHVKAGTYTLSKISTTRMMIAYFSDAPVNNAQGTILSSVQTSPRTVTVSADGFIVAFIYNNSGETNTWENVLNSIQLEVGEQATAYEPATITPHPVDLTGITPSVYGCEINPITGEVWGTWKSQTFTGAPSENWYFVQVGSSAWYRAYINMPDMKQENNVSIVVDSYKAVSFDDRSFDRKICMASNVTDNPQLLSIITDETSVNDFTAYLAENPMTIAYKLATPVLLATLTPQEIETLLGTNTIWSDADSIDLEYRADTGLFINQNSVKDVQVNGTSVTSDGVANVPLASSNEFGVIKLGDTLSINAANKVNTKSSSSGVVKLGTASGSFITPEHQHESAFYGLAKVAGKDLANETVTVGTYPDAALQAIQKLFGMAGILGPYEDDATADQAYAIGGTFVMNGKRYKATAAIAQGDVIAPGTNCELEPLDGRYVRNTDIASSTKLGLVKPLGNAGIYVTSQGNLCTDKASINGVKNGTSVYNPIVPEYQHVAVYYGLAKLAGADMASASGETVGVYPQVQKTAIQTMLGIEADIPLIEEVSGATPSITGMPNVRYICTGTVTELTVTPPASGSIIVRFTAGSNCIVSLPNTVKLPAWFDITSLTAGTTYEIMITDGVYGAVMSWA